VTGPRRADRNPRPPTITRWRRAGGLPRAFGPKPQPLGEMTVSVMFLLGIGLVCLGTMPDAGPRKDGWS